MPIKERVVKLVRSKDGNSVRIHDVNKQIDTTQPMDEAFATALAGRPRCFMYCMVWGETLVLDGVVMKEHEPTKW